MSEDRSQTLFVTTRELGRRTSELLDAVAEGSKLVITRHGVPVATIVETDNAALIRRARKHLATEPFEDEPEEPLDLASLNLDAYAFEVLDAFERVGDRRAQIKGETGLTVSQTGAAYGLLEIRGLIRRLYQGYGITDLGLRAVKAWRAKKPGERD